MKSYDVVTLRDGRSQARARIVPELGFNCYSFEAVVDGQPCELIWSAANFLSGSQKPSRSGIPLLFPFAGRIRGTSFQFEEETYTLPPGDDFDNAIHGFVLNRAWRVVDEQPDRVTGEFQASIDDASLLSHWPADFRIRMTYAVGENRLLSEVEVHNPDNRPLPFWFGTHPYFRVPLVAGSEAGDCRIRVPADSYWELSEMLPTGRVLPAAGRRDLRKGAGFANLKIDDVLSDLTFNDGLCQASVEDPDGGQALRIRFGSEFDTCVVFTPPHREAVCIEPYSSVSNAFELQQHQVPTGLRILAPGETFRGQIEMALEPFRKK